ncbi:MAG: TonB-dependent receptor plug domain-containing protein [Noviherbaspirillum sp.]
MTSVSKKEESLIHAAASVFVITNDEIRRSGATTLPEALRLAPNLQVARVDARNYAITARGFNNPFANKLLVMIDGRTVYSPLFSGVFWDAQDVVLEDIERIEVISGPGATMWGANAVNGVINVITRPAAATQGSLAAVGASKNERQGVVRHGGSLDNGGHYRVYGKYIDNDDLQTADGTTVPTGWRRKQTGFRTDWGSARRRFTLQGDAYDGGLHQIMTREIGIAGANLLGRMETRLADGSEASLQAYWDYTERKQPLAFIEYLNTLDLQFQHSLQAGRAHNITWGGGYRLARDRVTSEQGFAFLPRSLDMHWGNIFAQDEIALRNDLALTLGLKLENNNYTSNEFLPTARLSWALTPDSLLWGAVSRSVRAPSRIDRDLFSPSNPPVVDGVPLYFVAGGPDFESEVAKVLEIGYRAQPASNISYSITAFHARHERLRTLEPNPDGFGTVFLNGAEGRVTGVEMWGSWRPAQRWRLSGGLVAQRVRTDLTPGHADLSGATGLASSDPSHYWMLRASYDIAPRQELDLTLRRVGRLGDSVVPSYTELDLRYGWQLRRGLELSLVGQNLLDSSHPEFGAPTGRSEAERALFVKLVWRL